MERQTLIEQYGTLAEAARVLGIPRTTLSSRVNSQKISREVEILLPPTEYEPIEELVSRRIDAFSRKKAHEQSRKLIPVIIKEMKPIGIWHFGDPHIDDDGSDICALQHHARLIATTPGLYGANVGDTTNNWVGRLGALYAKQGTSAQDAWRLAEWFIREVRDWLYMVGGNHDAWSGSGDPLQYICRSAGTYYVPHEVRLALQFPNQQEIRINCRHDFAGSSVYNPAHGPMKALQFGLRDHVAIAGHKHESAYGLLKDPSSGITMHAIKVASYKVYDSFAREKGFPDRTLSPGCMTVINPTLPDTHPDVVKVFWDIEEGIEFLNWKRA